MITALRRASATMCQPELRISMGNANRRRPTSILPASSSHTSPAHMDKMKGIGDRIQHLTCCDA